MKIVRNLKMGYKLFKSIRIFNSSIRQIALTRATGDMVKERAEISMTTNKWALKVVDLFKIKLNVIGEENLPEHGPVVFISNHQGYADIVAFLAAIKNIQISFVAKDTLRKAPYFGKWIVTTRGVFIKRGDVRSSLTSINQGADLLKQGFSLIIFPEGTRSQGKEMKKIKPGSFKLATKALVPLIPVTINGSYKLYEETGYLTKGQTIDFVIHKPIDTAKLNRNQLKELPIDVENIIKNCLNELNENEKKEV